jgi:hypothetical protein
MPVLQVEHSTANVEGLKEQLAQLEGQNEQEDAVAFKYVPAGQE